MLYLKEVSNIFGLEDEIFMSYLYGTRLSEHPHLRNSRSVFRGLFLQCLQVIYRMMKNFRPRESLQSKIRLDYLLYAGTQNQMLALQPTLQAFISQDVKACAFVERGIHQLLDSKEGTSPITYSLSDIARSILLLLMRAPSLRRRLSAMEMAPALLGNTIRFASAYTYVPYFLRILTQTQPAYVLVSNDHNVSNRALIAVAIHLKIETVYMQHASVSKYFPPLRFNYAFLDGQAGLKTYQKCEGSRSKPSPLYPLPKVFLSGQKKALSKCDSSCRQTRLGIAINTLDGLEESVALTRQLARAGFEVCLRWHPALAKDYVEKLNASLLGQPEVTYSDPSNSSISDFLRSCFAVIASNTSIHLEAVLSGVPSIYFEISPLSSPDVYGYVQNGLVPHLVNSQELILSLMDIANEKMNPINLKAIRFYSASYGTEWEGREGELVAETLEKIRHRKTLEGLFVKESNSSGFTAVYALN
jgi:hypothetical protein